MSPSDHQIPDALRAFMEQGHQVFQCEDGDWRINIRKPDSSKPVPEGAIIIAENGVGDVLFLKAADDGKKSYHDTVHAYWHEGPHYEVFANSINELIHPKPKAYKTALYFHGNTEVHVGDRVCVRGLFRRRMGTVTYVPGISPKDPEMEHHSLTWVGIRVEGGNVFSTIVDPESFRLKKNIAFVARGA